LCDGGWRIPCSDSYSSHAIHKDSTLAFGIT